MHSKHACPPLTFCRFASINNLGVYCAEEGRKAKSVTGRKGLKSAADIQAHGPAHHRDY